MDLIVAVYDDWGIGKDGTQPVALTADRKFFRRTTKDSVVIVGRRTVEDFPDRKPLPGRINLVLSHSQQEIPGFTICTSPEEAVSIAGVCGKAFVIGGGSIYRQMLPRCSGAYVTKVHCCPESDTFFPNLDMDADWKLDTILESGEEQGISYEICRYIRK